MTSSPGAFTPHETPPLASKRRERVLSFLNQHISDPITVPDVAKAVGMSPRSFCRAFTATMGVTPWRYLMGLRMAKARHLLCQAPDCSLCAIAMECGFSSQSHFTTAFKAATGITPGAFRRRCRSILIVSLMTLTDEALAMLAFASAVV